MHALCCSHACVLPPPDSFPVCPRPPSPFSAECQALRRGSVDGVLFLSLHGLELSAWLYCGLCCHGIQEQSITPTLAAYGSLVQVLRAADRAPEALVVWRDLLTRMDAERRSLSTPHSRSPNWSGAPGGDGPSAFLMGASADEPAAGGGRRSGRVRGSFTGQGVAPFSPLIPDEGIMDDLVHVCVRAGYFQVRQSASALPASRS